MFSEEMKHYNGFMKTVKQCFLIILPVFIIMSCTVLKAGVVYDATIPEEKSARLYTGNVGTVTGFNGTRVRWVSAMGKYTQIPTGDTTLEYDLHLMIGTKNTVGKGVLFQYDYLPEKQYIFLGARVKGVPGLNVYSYHYRERIPFILNEKKLEKNFIAFVPFLKI